MVAKKRGDTKKRMKEETEGGKRRSADREGETTNKQTRSRTFNVTMGATAHDTHPVPCQQGFSKTLGLFPKVFHCDSVSLGYLRLNAPTYFVSRISLFFLYDEDKRTSFITARKEWYVIGLLFSELSSEITKYISSILLKNSDSF